MLAWFKFQAKIPRRSRLCVQGEWQKYVPPSPPLSNDEGLRDIRHSMSIRNLTSGVNSVTVSYLIHYDSLIQNATDVITKCGRSLLQNASRFLLHYNDFNAKCDSYYKLATAILLQNATVITKCDVYYK